MSKEKNKTWIVFNKYSPYMVVDLEHLVDGSGKKIPLDPVTSLCRCGASKYKPHCDGSHGTIGFVGEKKDDRVLDKVKEYAGSKITIVDNRGVCAHDQSCVRKLPEVFREKDRPWINPDGATVDKIVETIRTCPSGALSYKLDGEYHTNFGHSTGITAATDGPLLVHGSVELKDDQGSTPQNSEHCTLCRCGESKNKPFCDGAHIDAGFKSQ